MSELNDDLFKGIEQAKVRVDANYEKAGQYLMRIDHCKMIESSNRKGKFFIVEKTVIKVIDNNNGEGHRVGECVSHCMQYSNEYFLQEMKEFISRCLGVEPEEVTPSMCTQVFSDTQPLRYTVVDMNNRDITTKAGGIFTRVKYKGYIPFSQVKDLIEDEAVDRFFPDGLLDKLIEQEQ